jgi:hypothetical protein
MNHPLSLAALVATSAIALAAPACDPPIYFVGDDAGGAPVDGASDAVAISTATCIPCVEAADTPGPGCGTEYAACEADATCGSLWECVVAAHCIGGPPSKFISCALPCANEAGGIPSAAASLFECLANGPCAPACVAK